MRFYASFLSLIVATSLFAGTSTWFQVDATKNFVNWHATKVTGEHKGTVAWKSGKMEWDGKKLVGAEFVLDMTTLKNTDLKDAGMNTKLVNHLKSDDFFSAEKFPEATWVVKKAVEKNGTWECTGPLTIKGVTNEVTIPMKVEWKGTDTVAAKGKATLDRTKWQVKYGSGKFFENLGDKMIHDNFDLAFDFTAKKGHDMTAKK